jgi:hypothetical protein
MDDFIFLIVCQPDSMSFQKDVPGFVVNGCIPKKRSIEIKDYTFNFIHTLYFQFPNCNLTKKVVGKSFLRQPFSCQIAVLIIFI